MGRLLVALLLAVGAGTVVAGPPGLATQSPTTVAQSPATGVRPDTQSIQRPGSCWTPAPDLAQAGSAASYRLPASAGRWTATTARTGRPAGIARKANQGRAPPVPPLPRS